MLAEGLIVALCSGLGAQGSSRKQGLSNDYGNFVQEFLEAGQDALVIEVCCAFLELFVCLDTLLTGGAVADVFLDLAEPEEFVAETAIVGILLIDQEEHFLAVILEGHFFRSAAVHINEKFYRKRN